MARHKWDIAEYALLTLPFLMLAAYLADLPFFVPGDLLPERRYLALSASTSAEALKAARGKASEAFVVTEDGLMPLPPRSAPASAFREAASRLPARPRIGPVAADLAKGLPRWRRARAIVAGALCAEETAALDAAAR